MLGRIFILCSVLCACGAAPRPDFLVPPPKDADLRVVSWNIKGARASSLTDIAARLSTLDADVISLQEVDRGVPRSGSVDQTAELGKALGYYSIFGKAIDFDGGAFGIAVLSRFPIDAAEQLSLTNAGVSENRTALEVNVCTEGRCFRVVNHHADCIASAAETNVLDVLREIRPAIGSGMIFEGDFNQQPSSRGPRSAIDDGLDDLVERFQEAPSFGSERIDYIFADQPLALRARRAGVVFTPESDHDAVVADFDFSASP
jgi:endonuclease/exonuclease/phosphatase family metal-dependent hydrolase